MARRKRRISPKGKHGRGGKQNGGVQKVWIGDEGKWDRDFLAGFKKQRERMPMAEETSEAELMKVSMLVAAKAKPLRIRADKAGKLAALLCEDFHMMRVQLITDLVKNPRLLESMAKVLNGEGGDCDEECDCGANEGEEAEAHEETAEAEGAAADA